MRKVQVRVKYKQVSESGPGLITVLVEKLMKQ